MSNVLFRPMREQNVLCFNKNKKTHIQNYILREIRNEKIIIMIPKPSLNHFAIESLFGDRPLKQQSK